MKFKTIYKAVPNTLTLLNSFFGCLAIVAFLKVDEGIIFMNAMNRMVVRYPQEFVYGSLFVCIAAIFDFLDGLLARWLKAYSDVGKQLDSLADFVSFGVAPSVLMYQFLYIAFSRSEIFTNIPELLLSVSFLLTLSSAYRLAKYNTLKPLPYFIGLPTPSVAIFIVSLTPLFWTNFLNLNQYIFQPFFLVLVILILSFLMNSKIRFYSPKYISYKSYFFIIVVILALLLLIFCPLLAIPICFAGYVLFSIIHQPKIIKTIE